MSSEKREKAKVRVSGREEKKEKIKKCNLVGEHHMNSGLILSHHMTSNTGECEAWVGGGQRLAAAGQAGK